MSKRSEVLGLLATALVVFAPLLACKRKAVPGHHSATPAPSTTPATTAGTGELPEDVPDDTSGAPVIDASRATDSTEIPKLKPWIFEVRAATSCKRVYAKSLRNVLAQ